MTKKILCSAFALLAVCTMLSGCQTINSLVSETDAGTTTATALQTEPAVADSQAAQTPEEKSQEQTDVESQPAPDEIFLEDDFSKQMVVTFLETLKSGDSEAISQSLMTGENYDFFDDFKVDSYTMKPSADQIFVNQTSYDVVLNISGSSCEMFPDGQSSWRVTSGDGVSNIDEFYPLDKVQEVHQKNEINSYQGKYDGTLLKQAYDSAYNFSFATKCFDINSEDLKSYQCDSEAIHFLYHSLDESQQNNVPVSDITAEFKKKYNLTISEEDFSSVSWFDGMVENGIMLGGCGHGGSWYFYDLKSSSETDSTITVNIEYYGDSAYLLPVRESSYVFNKNSDGTITLDSVTNVNNTGMELARGAV